LADDTMWQPPPPENWEGDEGRLYKKVVPNMDAYYAKMRAQEKEDLGFEIVEEDFGELSKISESRHKPFLWVHIHKAAGTTICELAKRNGEAVISPSLCCDWIPYDVYNYEYLIKELTFNGLVKNISCAQRAHAWERGNFTWGHVEHDFYDSDFCPHDFRYGVALRHPVRLVESMMNFFDPWELLNPLDDVRPDPNKIKECALSGNENHCPGAWWSHTVDNLWMYFDNIMVRTLGGPEVMALPFGGVNSTHLDRVLGKLAKFEMVLLVEELASNSSQTAFRESLGWTHAQIIHRNSHNGTKRYFLTDAEQEVFKKVDKYDYELYNRFSKGNGNGLPT